MLTSRNRFHLYEIARRTLCKQKGKRGGRSRGGRRRRRKMQRGRCWYSRTAAERESIDRIISLNLRAEGTDTRGSRRRFLCHEMQSGPIPRLIDFVNATDRKAKERERGGNREGKQGKQGKRERERNVLCNLRRQLMTVHRTFNVIISWFRVMKSLRGT